MPPEYVPARRSAASTRSNRSSTSAARASSSGAIEAVQPADELEVLPAREELVDGRGLTREPDELPHALRVAGDVDPGDADGAAVGSEQRGDRTHERGLAGAVRSEQADDLAGGRRGTTRRRAPWSVRRTW